MLEGRLWWKENTEVTFLVPYFLILLHRFYLTRGQLTQIVGESTLKNLNNYIKRTFTMKSIFNEYIRESIVLIHFYYTIWSAICLHKIYTAQLQLRESWTADVKPEGKKQKVHSKSKALLISDTYPRSLSQTCKNSAVLLLWDV